MTDSILFNTGTVLLLISLGIYCLLTMKNLIKLFIGIEIISKGLSLGLITAGKYNSNLLIAQSLTVTFIVVEVCVVAVALALIIAVYKHTKSLDIGSLSKLKG